MKAYRAIYYKAKHHKRKQESKYQWPADRVTEKEMAILYKWRKRTGMPINLLVARAIIEMDKMTKIPYKADSL